MESKFVRCLISEINTADCVSIVSAVTVVYIVSCRSPCQQTKTIELVAKRIDHSAGGSCSTSETDWQTDRDDAVTTRKSLARYTPANCSAMPLQLPEKRPSAMLLDDWLTGLYPGRGINGFIIPTNYQSWLNNLCCWLCKCQRVVVNV